MFSRWNEPKSFNKSLKTSTFLADWRTLPCSLFVLLVHQTSTCGAWRKLTNGVSHYRTRPFKQVLNPLLFSHSAPRHQKTVPKSRHNYSYKWNYHNIYSRLKQNISEHMSSEKPPPPSTYNHKTAFMLRDNQREEVVLSAVFGSDLTRPAVWPRLGSLLVGLSCYVPCGLIRLALAGFSYKPPLSGLTTVGSVVWCRSAGPEIWDVACFCCRRIKTVSRYCFDWR